MNYGIATIKEEVRKVLSENEQIETLLDIESDTITPENDALIESLICPAVNEVHSIAPQGMISDAAKEVTVSAEEAGSDGYCTRLNVTNMGFLRLVTFKAPAWRVPVYSLTDSASEEYQQARSPFSYMRRKERDPMVSVVLDGGGMYVEAYPRHMDGDAVMRYVKQAETINEGGERKVCIASLCHNAVLYKIASLYYTTINEKERATQMDNRCLEMLNLKKNKQDGTNQQG